MLLSLITWLSGLAMGYAYHDLCRQGRLPHIGFTRTYRAHLRLPTRRDRVVDFAKGPNWFQIRAGTWSLIVSFPRRKPA